VDPSGPSVGELETKHSSAAWCSLRFGCLNELTDR
jgi:hypothetical protein